MSAEKEISMKDLYNQSEKMYADNDVNMLCELEILGSKWDSTALYDECDYAFAHWVILNQYQLIHQTLYNFSDCLKKLSYPSSQFQEFSSDTKIIKRNKLRANLNQIICTPQSFQLSVKWV